MYGPYLPRHLSRKLRAYLAQFPAVLLLGPRQVGKTTLLSHELKGITAFDLEDAGTAERVANDPSLFLRDHPGRIWLDEAHRVPELFPALRVAIDRDRRPGRFVLSGSATGAMASCVSESLAGRAGVLTLEPLTMAERLREPPAAFLKQLLHAESADHLVRLLRSGRAVTDEAVRSAWFSGGFPEPALLANQIAGRRWFDSYIRLVSERDLGELHRELRAVLVRRLLRMLAARHGQMVNVAALATDFGLPAAKIRIFLELLEGAFLWKRVEAYSANIGKRITRSPRGWIADAGLLHALLELRSPHDLLTHPLAGSSWEGWILQQFAAQASVLDAPPTFSYWRTHAGAEVDIVIEVGSRLIPLEIKRSTRVGSYDLRGLLSFLEAFGDHAPLGVVLYNGDHVGRPSDRILLIPVARVL